MTQTYHAAARYDDEVLRFWAALALQQQAAQEAIHQYLCDKAQQTIPYPSPGAGNNQGSFE
ncbi:hypothetical protein HNO53_03385 [Billgrantia antri]|uniref:Uncharacterized protein n=1 Tax=Halomonas sulfidivorans TaxID=2733488 RepID=A0ABX7WEA9_9GAMM|nr:hypothetical protein [Halomonas sulfidivorans]QTP57852.1 hypothetical protein HNO53_03385 [Halomonas sulfidivorans]